MLPVFRNVAQVGVDGPQGMGGVASRTHQQVAAAIFYIRRNICTHRTRLSLQKWWETWDLSQARRMGIAFHTNLSMYTSIDTWLAREFV